ncbi:hypothetical protein SAMN05428975_4693 [Mucilaginibacter sp. OK268]|nr:hypothetical protein SAMN05428975_4693 [Mucilaginibacter sp. OK268]
MKKSQTLKAIFEIATVFKFQPDSKALHLTETTTVVTTSSTATITSVQSLGFQRLPNSVRI